MKKLMEEIFYIVSVVVVLVGGCFWLSNMSYQSTSNASDLQILKSKTEETNKQFEEIRIRLAHIEDAVGGDRD